MKYYILKQFLTGTQIWVWKLNDTDIGYVFDTQEEAEDMCLYLESQDNTRKYKVSTDI